MFDPTDKVPPQQIERGKSMDYPAIRYQLLSQSSDMPLFSLPTSPKHLRYPGLAHQIANLSIHPTLESGLHILNLDLPAAHFLLRHMQDPQQCPEGAFLHGILHRIEGDIENARAWYRSTRDANGEVFKDAWAHANGPDEASQFLDKVERSRKEGGQDVLALQDQSFKEIQSVIAYCERKFGTAKVVDASTIWVGMSEDHRQKAGDMVVGGEGWRTF